VAENIVEIQFVCSKEMPADALTKGLPQGTHYHHFSLIGMHFGS
jgi:hypothetical protein